MPASRRSRGGPRGAHGGHGGYDGVHRSRQYPRTARVNEVLREVIADELERIGDDRLGLVTVTGITVDPDFRHAKVWVSALTIDGGVAAVSDALEEHRAHLQAAVARQVRLKRTPLLHFESDPAITNGQRIESILRTLPPIIDDEPVAADADEPANSGVVAPNDDGATAL